MQYDVSCIVFQEENVGTVL